MTIYNSRWWGAVEIAVALLQGGSAITAFLLFWEIGVTWEALTASAVTGAATLVAVRLRRGSARGLA